jgi:hypothetical protein
MLICNTLFSAFIHLSACFLFFAAAATGYNVVHPGDVSLMTYRGHAVLQTLIRAYFSPAHTTGQRYIYAGSAEGVINAWDLVSGKPVSFTGLNMLTVAVCVSLLLVLLQLMCIAKIERLSVGSFAADTTENSTSAGCVVAVPPGACMRVQFAQYK